jgi:hypothetical protein
MVETELSMVMELQYLWQVVLLKKSQVHTDWPGLKRKEMYEGRDLNATIDARSVYASAMSTCI